MNHKRWLQLMFIASILIGCSAHGLTTYFITPSPDTSYSGGHEHCHAVSQYAADQSFNDLPMNGTIQLPPGNHYLDQNISFGNLTWLTILYGDTSSLPETTSRIICTWPVGLLVFKNMTELHITALVAFISRGHYVSGSTTIASVQNSNCAFLDNSAEFNLVEGMHSPWSKQFQSELVFAAGALAVRDSTVNITSTILENNSAYSGGAVAISTGNLFLSALNGGGLLLSENSKLHLSSNTVLHVSNNRARIGYAMEVKESNSFSTCTASLIKPWPHTCTVSGGDYYFQLQLPGGSPLIQSKWLKLVSSLHPNYSIQCSVTGSTSISRITFSRSCVLIDTIETPQNITLGSVFDAVTSSSNAIDMSSDPVYLCTCRDNGTDCNGSYHTKQVYPGGTVEIPVIALGQRNTSTKAVIQVADMSVNLIVGNLEISQNITKYCHILQYTIYSSAVGSTHRMSLLANGPCSPTQKIEVTVDVQPCPPGLQLSSNEKKCICAERLQRYTSTCLADNGTVLRQRNAEFWVGYINDNANESDGLIIHSHCPFDFCTIEEVYVKVIHNDNQCACNRSGVLCGGCRNGLSLGLGSSCCLQCSNSYLSLIVAFIVAGMALVLLLLVLRLTVAAGTINGLIFYANVITMNSSTFFCPKTTNILTVFIAWVNLDLGVETCFGNGMDAYIKTWLQFVFPIYVWVIVAVIIIASYYSGKVARVFGRNPVAVLATLFLLSYAKLLRTAIATLSYTNLEYPNSHIAVWLSDGNIRYLSGKHIPLFAAGLVCLIFLFLPYTVLLIFGQWLQARSEWKLFSWVNNRYVKPFIDAYHAPYCDIHRYWTGLTLLVRFILFLISAVTALDDPRVNLLAVAASAVLALPVILGARVYRSWCLGLLETSFHLNLTILILTTLYSYPDGGNQNAATFTSVGIALGTFIAVVIYHSIQQTRSTQLWKRVTRYNFVSISLTDNPLEPESPPEHPRSAPTQTIIDMRELREPCMATN